jgi:CPA2 family monovalent cation:H+ antiporter-2
MPENPLLSDLGIIAFTAALAAILFDRLRLPVILGYLLTGLLIGPHFLPHPLVPHDENVRSIAELGVVFLLFTLGIEFDLKKLQHLLSTSVAAVALQTVVMTYLGIQIAPLIGYSKITGLFLGCLLSVSSSMVTIRVLREQTALKLPHGQLAIGILILEDILAVLLLVVLSGISASGALPWDSIAWSIFLIGIFVVAVFYVGRLTMPVIIRAVHRIGSLELVTLFAVGSALGIGVLAETAHLSLALGAFVAGSLFSNSPFAPRIEASIAPIKELFSAIFFVSTGMLLNPASLASQIWIILLLSVAVVAGKVASCGIGLFLAGQRSKPSFKAAIVKSQIGEFSFVIANLAFSMGIADQNLVTIAVGVSFITIITTPILARHSDRIFHTLFRLTPSGVRQSGKLYHRLFCSIQSQMSRSFFFSAVKRPFWQIVVAFFLINGMIIGTNLLCKNLVPDLQNNPSNRWMIPALWMGCAVLVSPFLLSILRNVDAVSLMLTELIGSGSRTFQRLSGGLRHFMQSLISLMLAFLIGGTFISALTEFMPGGYSLILFFLFILILAIAFQRQMIHINSQLEHRFTRSFDHASRQMDSNHRNEALERFHQEFNWDSVCSERIIPEDSNIIGRPLFEVGLREKSGATIIAITRGGETVYDPNPGTYLFPGDEVVLLGNESQIQEADRILHQSRDANHHDEGSKLKTEAVYVEPGSFLEGNTLAGSQLRKLHRITAIGIKRGNHPVMDPNAHEVMRSGDLLLIMGKTRHVEAFKKSLYHSPETESTAA